jgi:hypothetical protein
LKLAALAAWLILPVFLFVVHRLFERFGFPPWERSLLTLAVGMHPLICHMSTGLISDLLFMSLFLGCLMFAERALNPSENSRWRWSLV